MKNLIFPRIFLGRVLGPLGFYLEKIPGLERRPEKGDLSTQRGEGMRGAYIGSTFFLLHVQAIVSESYHSTHLAQIREDSISAGAS